MPENYNSTEEVDARLQASDAYHKVKNNFSNCLTYGAYYGKPCPCESKWKEFMPKDDNEG